MVNYLSAKDLIEVRRVGGFSAETGSADISAPADISAQRTVATLSPNRGGHLSLAGEVAVETTLRGRNPRSLRNA
jgi:hypothetical protein